MLRYKVRKGNEIGGTVNLEVPLSTAFGLVPNRNSIINEKFFERAKETLIPEIRDMEKVVLYPAVCKKSDDGTLKFDLADEININFHFRNRIIDENKWMISTGWAAIEGKGWNEKYFHDADDATHGNYNTGSTEYDASSDLIGFLGFDDDDIKYQKSKVKQSFLRLLYYSSNDIINKSLITYTTSFLDSNKLFSKYTSLRNNSDFLNYYNGSNALTDDNAPKNVFSCFEPAAVDEKYKGLRLSSQILLKSKMFSDASSDGFYMYLFKEDAPSKVPKRLYLKGEFNNAGYGKTVSLTIPHTVNDDETISVIQYSSPDFPTTYTKDYTLHTDGGEEITSESGKTFDYEKYNNNTFLPVDCVYDENLRKYIYYFPWDLEGGNGTATNDFKNKKITLNFWEPKLV